MGHHWYEAISGPVRDPPNHPGHPEPGASTKPKRSKPTPPPPPPSSSAAAAIILRRRCRLLSPLFLHSLLFILAAGTSDLTSALRTVRPAPPLPCADMTGSSKKHELKSKQKLEKKLGFYTKVKDAVTSLNAKKTISKKTNQSRRQKKLKAYDLSTLSEFLPEPAEPEQKTEEKLNCKSRQTLVLRETAHLKAVLNNPQFQIDPFAAIQQHLLATQPPAAVKKDDAAKQGKDSKDKKRRRKKKKGASSSSQAMDI